MGMWLPLQVSSLYIYQSFRKKRRKKKWTDNGAKMGVGRIHG
jgi:hypothetical protein